MKYHECSKAGWSNKLHGDKRCKKKRAPNTAVGLYERIDHSNDDSAHNQRDQTLSSSRNRQSMWGKCSTQKPRIFSINVKTMTSSERAIGTIKKIVRNGNISFAPTTTTQ